MLTLHKRVQWQTARQHHRHQSERYQGEAQRAGEIVLHRRGRMGGHRLGVDGEQAVDRLGPHDQRQGLDELPAAASEAIRRHHLKGS